MSPAQGPEPTQPTDLPIFAERGSAPGARSLAGSAPFAPTQSPPPPPVQGGTVAEPAAPVVEEDGSITVDTGGGWLSVADVDGNGRLDTALPFEPPRIELPHFEPPDIELPHVELPHVDAGSVAGSVDVGVIDAGALGAGSAAAGSAAAGSAAGRRTGAGGSRSCGLTSRITQPSVDPCRITVTKIAANAASSIRSRPGISAGSASGTASVTTPRMPAHPSTVACRHPIGRARRQPARTAARKIASDPKT